ncbi:Phage portal protein, lambda family [Phycisphaerae bacterium RAS1]|nr:Phage portal protein, lambda family [Phycisphaerae bacterium RAS1]
MIQWLRTILAGRRLAHESDAGRVRARYDAARTTGENARHWANADGLSASAAANPEVLATIRNRARHEVANNAYVDGTLQTICADVVGRTPVLQMRTGDDAVDALVEQQVGALLGEINIGEKLRLMLEAQIAAGECFAQISRNPRLRSAVKLDLAIIEADQIATPDRRGLDDSRQQVDGIRFDRWGNPVEYHVLKQHPGDLGLGLIGLHEYDRVDAQWMVHLFRPRRPGQRRGVSRLASSLQLSAQRRSMRASVVSAARKVAGMGAITIETQLSAEEAEPPPEFETLDIEDGMMTVLPAGATARQLAPTQPGTTFGDFDDRLIREQARSVNAPFAIAAGDSSKSNYASGRLDFQAYDRCNEIDRADLERKVLDRLLLKWIEWAVQIEGYLPYRAKRLLSVVPMPGHAWLWREREHVDPVKGAEARRIRLATRQSTLSDELAAEGKDLEAHVAQLRRESNLLAEAGLANQAPLAGPQIVAALEVLNRLQTQSLAKAAAIELLVMLGLPRDRAEKMAAARVPAPRSDAPDDESDDRAAPPGLARPHRNGNRLTEAWR